MFKFFFFSELKYALRQPMVYIFFGLITLLIFLVTVSDHVMIGGAIGNVYKNAPHVITVQTAIMTIFGLLIATAFYNNAALRDYKNGFDEILFSTPLSKFGYFFGRFFGALVLSTIPMLGVFIGVFLGAILAPVFGWVDAERFGSFYLETFVNNYLIFILPNMFFVGSIVFSISSKWRSTIVSFIGVLIIIIAYIISGTLTSDIDNQTIASLTDTFGIHTYSIQTKYYTPIEKNTQNLSFSGLLMLNRILWLSVGFLIIIVSYFNFSFREKNLKPIRKKKKNSKEDKNSDRKSFVIPALNPVYTLQTHWCQFKSFFKINFLSITKSITFKIVFLFSTIILMSNLVGGFEYYGLQSYPLTYKMVDTITNTTSFFVIIILVFFSGELIWRDREHKINEVIDATAHASLVSLVAKTLSLVSIAVLLHGFLIICGVMYQLINGFYRIELEVYFIYFVLKSLPIYILISSVMIVIQIIINRKYIGYFICIIILFGSDIILSIFDIQSNMLSIGSSPSMIYSDMNGFGPSLTGVVWFDIYWVLFSFMYLLIGSQFWNRGVAKSLKKRIQNSEKRTSKSHKYWFRAVVFCWLSVAAFVYYNTQVLNEYKTPDESEQLMATYEKTYKKYENMPLPKIKNIKYFVDIYPYKRNVVVKAKMTLVNESQTGIDSIHYNINMDWNPEINIPNAQLVLDDKTLEYRIYKLSKPLKPNEQIDIEINTKYISRGFENGIGNTHIVNNGTFLNNFQILPTLGYNDRIELTDKNIRKKYGLKPKNRMPKLEADCSENRLKNYLTNGTSDYINVETIISTTTDQIAIAPGSKIKQWQESGRNYYHYRVDHPSQNFYSFTSAKYKVKSRKWQGVDIEIYYDEKHSQNIDVMLDAAERSLAYYTEHFGPYMHKQCRIIEFPRYATFAQSFPGTMPYSEAYGFVINLEDEQDNNIIDAVIAHEIAHQWWAHQVVGAKMQGATMLSESFAEYASLMTMKSIAKTSMTMRTFLKYNHDRYLNGRSGETDKELPLYKVENQQYIHYGKGSIVLYALQDYIGEQKVNTAMQNFLNAFRYKKTPYPTSLDFIEYLKPQVPDSLQYLINDGFKNITLYDNRMQKASYKKLDNGKYQITMEITSKKILADTIGNETSIKLDDWIDIGVFSDIGEAQLIFEKRVRINKPKMKFIFEINKQPAKMAIDPRHLLIDRVYDDNIKNAEGIMADKK